MTKPKEFWVELKNMCAFEEPPAGHRPSVHVREVVVIDWNEVWASTFVNDDKKSIIQQAVEKQLKGEK